MFKMIKEINKKNKIKNISKEKINYQKRPGKFWVKKKKKPRTFSKKKERANRPE